eukprot:9290451-Karenia_brevis.AAC.1
MFSNQNIIRLRNYRVNLWLPGEIMTNVKDLPGSWIRARDARWYKYIEGHVTQTGGKTLEELDGRFGPIRDLSVVNDPKPLLKDKFVFDNACDRMKILSVEHGANGAVQYFPHACIYIPPHEAKKVLLGPAPWVPQGWPLSKSDIAPGGSSIALSNMSDELRDVDEVQAILDMSP